MKQKDRQRDRERERERRTNLMQDPTYLDRQTMRQTEGKRNRGTNTRMEI